MPARRMILEMGMGNDLHGGDYTKAALRAVNDALHHSSLNFHRALGVDIETLEVNVTIGVRQPDAVDAQAVKAALPHGKVSVRVVAGGLDVPGAESADPAVIASAAIEVWMEVPS